MTRTLEHALDALRDLPEDRQARLVSQSADMTARAKIDAEPVSGEKRGGATPADELFCSAKSRYRWLMSLG